MRISFLTSGHDPFDDRIFYHMARSLCERNHNVLIISSKRDLNEVADSININCFAGDNLTKVDKINSFTERLSPFKPDAIICSEPLTLLAAKRYSKRVSRTIRIIYDITEWYPSKKNLRVYKHSLRWFFFLKLLFFNFWTASLADSFIFGEWYKSRPYRFIFPGKRFVYTSYYPDLKYIPYCKPDLRKGKLRLCYSGKISREKGFGNFMSVIQKLIELKRDIDIEVNVIGWYENISDKEECGNILSHVNRNVTIKIFERQDLENFLELIKETDIFLDLRYDDYENQRCLPIKLFYYAALGRPVIFSDLRAIHKEVEIGKFGFLVNPGNHKTIANIILGYLNDEDLYYQHCRNARNLAENNYNWKRIESQFIKFISLL
jgi:glycosyltransferase involved in cell wall biosynthesis